MSYPHMCIRTPTCQQEGKKCIILQRKEHCERAHKRYGNVTSLSLVHKHTQKNCIQLYKRKEQAAKLWYHRNIEYIPAVTIRRGAL